MSQSATLFDPDAASAITLQTAAQFSPQGIVSRSLMARDGFRVTLFAFAAGQELTEHTSSSRALIQILSGSSEWTIDGKPQPLHAGEMLHLPPNMPHAVRAVESFSMLLTLVREPNAAPHNAAATKQGKVGDGRPTSPKSAAASPDSTVSLATSP